MRWVGGWVGRTYVFEGSDVCNPFVAGAYALEESDLSGWVGGWVGGKGWKERGGWVERDTRVGWVDGWMTREWRGGWVDGNRVVVGKWVGGWVLTRCRIRFPICRGTAQCRPVWGRGGRAWWGCGVGWAGGWVGMDGWERRETYLSVDEEEGEEEEEEEEEERGEEEVYRLVVAVEEDLMLLLPVVFLWLRGMPPGRTKARAGTSKRLRRRRRRRRTGTVRAAGIDGCGC